MFEQESVGKTSVLNHNKSKTEIVQLGVPLTSNYTLQNLMRKGKDIFIRFLVL